MHSRILVVVAAVGLLAGGEAFAGLGPNGLGPNGLGPNGLGPNGLGPNGLGPNGLGPNGLGPNGLGPNGLGPNGLGPNGLGPNGLVVNGLGPNGLGPNGLGPNGLIFVVTPDGTAPQSTFKDWFEGTPPSEATRLERAQFMRYFARCAYDGQTAIAYLDSTGKTWAWTGQYGFAMTSVKTTEYVSGLGTVRGRMTPDEGKWVSACILAHVNMKGTHQYISIRANAPNPEAAAALAQTTGEFWAMGEYHGAFFGDIFDGANPARLACRQHSDAAEAALLDVLLGRTCDAYPCGWTNPATQQQELVVNNLERCIGRTNAPIIAMKDEVMAPLYAAGTFFFPIETPVAYHPVFINGPVAVELEFAPAPGWSSGRFPGYHTVACAFDPGLGRQVCTYDTGSWEGTVGMVGAGVYTPPTSTPFDLAQTQVCAAEGSCSYGRSGAVMDQPGTTSGRKLVGIRAGQAIEGVVRYTGKMANSASGGLGTVPVLPEQPDMGEAFTALVRYSNCRATPAAATLAVSGPNGLEKPLGTEIWPSTIPPGATTCTAGENFTWLQVYPVRGYQEDTTYAPVGVRPTLKIALAGATQGESCTGTKLLKGDGETGTCALSSVYFDWKRLKVMCRESGESKPICRGDLVLDYRGGRWGWFCAYGGKAIHACTGADAPDLDAFAFVPGKPYCMPEGATSFVGVCP